MCGIAGFFGKKTISQTSINKTMQLMKNRGPDNQNYYLKKIKNHTLLFLHSRLSIIDLNSRSNQPYKYKNLILTYNGEIYNYVEIKNKLKKKGYEFDTTSDTEVLIKAFYEWREFAFEMFDGMWSLAIYDTKLNKLYLSRDPFGEKPLYVFQSSEGLYFGSEIKFIKSLINENLLISYEKINNYLINGYKSLFKNEDTFYKNVNFFPKASVGIIDLNKLNLKIFKYWGNNFQETNEKISFFDAAKETKKILIKQVEKRLRSDIPIAFCMSGGIDSNSLISIAKKVFNYNVKGFTILNSDKRYEEKSMIDQAKIDLGIDHYSFNVKNINFLDNLKKIINYHDAPVSTISFYLNWILQKEISKQGFKVSISGNGADEIFSGYYDHHLYYLYDCKNLKLFKNSLNLWQKNIKPLVRNPYLSDKNYILKNPMNRKHIYFKQDEFCKLMKFRYKSEFYEKNYFKSLLKNRMTNEIFHETTPVILHADDLNGMYHSIENRAPFLSKKLFEFLRRIPTEYYIKNGYTKSILRQAMKGIVSDRILFNKRKVGFNAPLFDLIGGEKSKVKDYLFNEKNNQIWDIVDRKKISQLFNQKYTENSISKFLFSIINIKIFLEQN